MLVSHFGLLVMAFVTAVVLTVIVRSVAPRLGLVDVPDALRKMHVRATPLGGGVAVLLATGIAIALTMFTPSAWGEAVRQNWGSLGPLTLAAVVLCAVGLIDDFNALRARQKFAGQVIACLIAMSSGLVVHHVRVLGYDIDLGILAWPITLFWLLGAINSVNLIDGADGLAATVGIILSVTIAGMAIITNHDLEAVVALALAGALLGFLIFNFPPATIFLGDAGSMVIGLLAGVLAIRCAIKGPATYAMIAPLAIWAVPAFDCGVAIVRRKLTGRSIATTDRGHLHHCLLRRGFDNRQMLCWVAVLCLITATGAIVSVRLDNELYAFAAVGVMVAVMVLTRIFGHAELLLVASSVRKLGASFVIPARYQLAAVRHSSHHLQGSRDWDSVWKLLLDAADDIPLQSVRLNLNLPWLHESYHASWEREPRVVPGEGWRLEMTLNTEGRSLGTLVVAGRAPAGQMAACMAQFSQRIGAIEDRLAALLAPPAVVEFPKRSSDRLPLSAVRPVMPTAPAATCGSAPSNRAVVSSDPPAAQEAHS